MALPVLDGNQTATTLSSVVTGGEHIVAHSVVSLGANAIANITSAVSGSVVSVSNFPASQSTTFGAVTGSISVLNFPSTQTVAGTVTANLANEAFTNAQGGIASDASGIEPNLGVQLGYYDGDYKFVNPSQPLPISGTVTIGNSVTISSLPAISGTVTANVVDGVKLSPEIVGGYQWMGEGGGGTPLVYGVGVAFPADITDSSLSYLASENKPFPVQVWAGSVTVGNSVTIGSLPDIAIGISPVYDSGDDSLNVNIKNIGGGASLSPSNTFPISGTVTVGSMPNGSLTTRFGTPTTANTAFATSAVTNANRKYLLIQNVTTGSNVITVGIGFTPTTTQGIQLTAGAGITFESSYIPTGAVMILSSVTASNFTILEA